MNLVRCLEYVNSNKWQILQKKADTTKQCHLTTGSEKTGEQTEVHRTST